MTAIGRCLPTVLGTVAFCLALSPAPAQESALTTMMVDLDGLRMRALVAGMDERGPSQAAIVFEGGGSAALETWDDVLPAVRRFAPVVAYDRAGTGESGWDGLPPTPERVAARLRNLLARLDVAPPYVLVGHSWGGALVRYFAGLHPDEVVGVLYLDPTDITMSPAEELAVFRSIGADASARDAFYQIQERGMANAPEVLRAEASVILGLMRSDLAERGLPAAPDVPTSIILAGKPAIFPPNVLPFDAAAYASAMQQARLQRLRSWAREPGRFRVATNSGHIIQSDDPDLVIEEIRRLAGAEL